MTMNARTIRGASPAELPSANIRIGTASTGWLASACSVDLRMAVPVSFFAAGVGCCAVAVDCPAPAEPFDEPAAAGCAPEDDAPFVSAASALLATVPTEPDPLVSVGAVLPGAAPLGAVVPCDPFAPVVPFGSVTVVEPFEPLEPFDSVEVEPFEPVEVEPFDDVDAGDLGAVVALPLLAVDPDLPDLSGAVHGNIDWLPS